MTRNFLKCKNCGELKPHHAKGLCKNCYNKQYKKPSIICKSCYKEKTHYAKGLCQPCYNKQNLIICKVCGEKKPHAAKGLCITCYKHKIGISKPMLENKDCSSYLGVHIAEKLLSKVFKNIKQMPYGNIGYDFICSKGMKIDVKSSILIFRKNLPNYKGEWHFTIRKNTIADYFLCLAFDNREDKNPQHLWLIPANKINYLQMLSISKNQTQKWSQYEQSLNKIIICCNKLK